MLAEVWRFWIRDVRQELISLVEIALLKAYPQWNVRVAMEHCILVPVRWEAFSAFVNDIALEVLSWSCKSSPQETKYGHDRKMHGQSERMLKLGKQRTVWRGNTLLLCEQIKLALAFTSVEA